MPAPILPSVELTAQQTRLIFVVYSSALAPLVAIVAMRLRHRLPEWIWRVYWAGFAGCALGWELWFTYGWVAGDSVNIRRAQALSDAIPIHANWLLNSLADAGSIGLFGLLLAWWLHGRDLRIFDRWHWSAFAVLFTWFIAQNLIVEMFLYHDQLAAGKHLSWAPFAPTGPWINPTLFNWGDRTITLQGQIPWLLMTPLYYLGVIGLRKQLLPNIPT
jgi:hypothetical protein